MKSFYECKLLKSPIHSLIGLIRMLNTVVGLAVSLANNEFVKMGNFDHSYKIFFGHLRIPCNCDHSYKNILLSTRKTLSSYDLNE